MHTKNIHYRELQQTHTKDVFKYRIEFSQSKIYDRLDSTERSVVSLLKLKNNAEIGSYLSTLILKKYRSYRAFCKAYLEYKDIAINDEEIRKLANRITQIIKGKKGIQIYDLPIITELLDVTCEEILSAGESFVPKNNRPTNYMIAFSKEKEDWCAFIKREDKLILNPDEYGKTAIDYALEFKNFDFLKYLIEEKYIWFDSGNDNDYLMTFGAGTSIKRRDPCHIDGYLGYKIVTEDQLRINIISLAIENNDFNILNELRAREIPELYCRAHYLSLQSPDINARFDEKFVQCIASASNDIINYFTEPFEVRDRIKYKDGSNRVHTFIFPYISELLDLLITNGHNFAEMAIEKCIEYNKKIYESIKALIGDAINNALNSISYGDISYRNRIKPNITKSIFTNYDFRENGNIVIFREPFLSIGIITNIVHTKATSSDKKLKHLIEKLNHYFTKIVEMQNEFEQ